MKLQLVAKNLKKIEGGTFRDMKKFPKKKFFNEIFEQCHSAKKCKRGALCDFLTSIVLQNIKKMKGDPLGKNFNPKSFKKSHSSEKSGGVLSVISRLWTSVLFFLFVLDALLRLELLRFEVVEQMNRVVTGLYFTGFRIPDNPGIFLPDINRIPDNRIN